MASPKDDIIAQSEWIVKALLMVLGLTIQLTVLLKGQVFIANMKKRTTQKGGRLYGKVSWAYTFSVGSMLERQ